MITKSTWFSHKKLHCMNDLLIAWRVKGHNPTLFNPLAILWPFKTYVDELQLDNDNFRVTSSAHHSGLSWWWYFFHTVVPPTQTFFIWLYSIVSVSLLFTDACKHTKTHSRMKKYHNNNGIIKNTRNGEKIYMIHLWGARNCLPLFSPYLFL